MVSEIKVETIEGHGNQVGLCYLSYTICHSLSQQAHHYRQAMFGSDFYRLESAWLMSIDCDYLYLVRCSE